MRRIFIVAIILALVAGPAWGTTYYYRANGTAANKEAAEGPCTTVANCMGPTVYAGETFSDGDVIVRCHTPIGLPGKIWSEGFVDVSVTLSVPSTATERVTIAGATRVSIAGATRVIP